MHSNGITDGGGYESPGRRCREADAMTAFEWFAFGAFAASFLVDLWNYKRGREGARGRAGGRGARGMGQV